MTKRKVGQEVEELSDELLEDLSPAERFRVKLKAVAKNRDAWLDRLAEADSEYDGQHRDTPSLTRGEFAFLVASSIVADFRGMVSVLEKGGAVNRTLLTYESIPDADLEQIDLPEAVPIDGASPVNLAGPLRELYVRYHGYNGFATEHFDISLKSWAALQPNGRDVITTVEQILTDCEDPPESAKTDPLILTVADLKSGAGAADDDVSLDAEVEQWYRELQDLWTNVVVDAEG